MKYFTRMFKDTPRIIFAILLVLLCACGRDKTDSKHSGQKELHLAPIDSADSLMIRNFYKPLEKDVLVGLGYELNEKIEGDFQAWDSQETRYVVYTQPINGYRVRLALHHEPELMVNLDANLSGTLFLSKAGRTICVSNFFHIEEKAYKAMQPHKINELDCIGAREPYSESLTCPYLGEFRSMPFFFLDIDFDGDDELILNYGGVGQRTCNAYLPLKLTADGYTPYELGVTADESDYPALDDLTQIDMQDSTIILYLSAGAQDNVLLFWKKIDGKMQLIRKEIH